MRIVIVSPASAGARTGNRTTTLRWAQILRRLGHLVYLTRCWDGRPCDLLIALHALKTHDSIRRFSAEHPGKPLVVVLGGTDLYRELHRSRRAIRSLELASRLVVLQPLAARVVPARFRSKIRVIYQSVAGAGRAVPGRPAPSRNGSFRISVIAHLRALKDPFRVALAVRLLPDISRARVFQIGGAMTPAMEQRARAEQTRNRRYRWMGSLPRSRTLQLLKQSDLLVISSLMEGGANVVGEAVRFSVPVIASRISGNVGLLGEDYPGYFRPRDTRGLAALLRRSETDRRFHRKLAAACGKRIPLFTPRRESRAWKDLLTEIVQEGRERRSAAPRAHEAGRRLPRRGR